MIYCTFGNQASRALLKRNAVGFTKSTGKSRQAGGLGTRNISIGTDLTDSDITLQKARPWVRILLIIFAAAFFISLV